LQALPLGMLPNAEIAMKGWHVSILRVVFKILVGVVFGAASVVALAPLLAAVVGEKPVGAVVVLFAVILLAASAPNIRRAFGRGFLCLGAAVFALPLSTMILSGVVASEAISMATDSEKAMTGFGGAVAGGLMTGVAGFIGFFFGSILLLIGLILSLGGRREVIVVMADNASSRGGGKQEPKA
jgi:hypothetical protein